MPGVARVVFAFLFTAGLAVAVAVATRRLWPGVLTRVPASARVRALGRTAVSRTLTVHLVEVDGVRVVIAESRTGVGLTVLSAVTRAESPP